MDKVQHLLATCHNEGLVHASAILAEATLQLDKQLIALDDHGNKRDAMEDKRYDAICSLLDALEDRTKVLEGHYLPRSMAENRLDGIAQRLDALEKRLAEVQYTLNCHCDLLEEKKAHRDSLLKQPEAPSLPAKRPYLAVECPECKARTMKSLPRGIRITMGDGASRVVHIYCETCGYAMPLQHLTSASLGIDAYPE